MLRRLFLILFAAACSGILVAPATGGARGRTTVIVRDGTWAGSAPSASGGAPDMALFDVRHHAISQVHLGVTLHCEEHTDGSFFSTYALMGSSFPDGHAIPRSGRLSMTWDDHDGQRRGTISSEFNWTGSPDVRFVITTDNSSVSSHETCSGIGIVHLKRGALPAHHVPTPPTSPTH